MTQLLYDAQSGRWSVGDVDLHCGDCFWVCADSPSLPRVRVRIENNGAGWYLVSPYGLLSVSVRDAALSP